jgi:hypothetical protein
MKLFGVKAPNAGLQHVSGVSASKRTTMVLRTCYHMDTPPPEFPHVMCPSWAGHIGRRAAARTGCNQVRQRPLLPASQQEDLRRPVYALHGKARAHRSPPTGNPASSASVRAVAADSVPTWRRIIRVAGDSPSHRRRSACSKRGRLFGLRLLRCLSRGIRAMVFIFPKKVGHSAFAPLTVAPVGGVRF